MSYAMTVPLFRPRALLALAFVLCCVAPAQSQVVISQVYGGGGNSGATFKNDFVELFNRGTGAVSLSGWSVQYAASTGTSWQKTDLTAVTLNPGQYYLVQESAGTGGTTNLPAPDTTGTINMSGTAGKVALVSNQTVITSGTGCPTGATIIDFVGFGTGTNCFEGTVGPTPAPSNTAAVFRAAAGCTDTNNNAADFAAAAPNPRTTATSLNPCTVSAPLSITTASPLPDGTIGQAYNATFAASGGAGGYVFALDSGTLPSNLTFANGAISGTPNAATVSPASFVIRVTDSANNTITKTFTLMIDAAPTCNPTQTISQIQGSGITSPFAGSTVTTRGIVTGVKSNGFFIQMPSPGDSDPNTSDGVFVFTSSKPATAATVGNDVCVTGTVAEFVPSTDPYSPSQTEINNATLFALSSGNALPAPVVLTAADASPSGDFYELEKYEGMRVQVTTLTVVGPTRGTVNEANATATSSGIFYGVVAGVPRPFREPGVELPDPLPAGSPCCVPRWDTNPEILSVNSVGQTGGTAIDVVDGATVSNVVGPLEYTGRAYTIDLDPASPPVVSGNNISYTAVPVPNSNELTIASMNMQRFFDTVDDPGISDVALTQTAFNNRLNKASLAIRNVLHYPDILGVEEMENITTLQAVANKVNADAVTAGDPNPQYQPYLVEGNDIGGIDVGFLVKTPKVNVISVTQYGKDTTYADPGSSTPALLNDRPPLVLQATATAPGSATSLPVIVIVNHLRSLSSVDDPTDGPRVRAKREAQAEFLANLIQTLGNGNPGVNIATIGDYNAFQFSDGYVDVVGVVRGNPVPANQVVTPPATITNPVLTDLLDTLPATQRYSYSFNGSAQVLDHFLVNPSLYSRFSRFAYGRMDADFPEDYRNDPNTPLRLSDHDPEVAYFLLPVQSAQTITFNTIADQTFGASPLTLSATASSGLTVTYSTSGTCSVSNGSTLTLNGAGSCSVTANQAGNASYAAASSVTRMFTINKAAAVVTISNTNAVYNGSPQSVTVTTTPANLATTVTYNGSTTPPGAIGYYAVVATVNDVNYQGTATTTFAITAAAGACGLSTLTGTYSAGADGRTISSSPNGAGPFSSSVTYQFNGSGGFTVSDVTNSNGSVVMRSGVGGSYTIDGNCQGTLTYASGEQLAIVTQGQGSAFKFTYLSPTSVVAEGLARKQ